MPLINFQIEFLTATILRWQHLLEEDLCKQIIVNSLQWLYKDERCTIYSFVIMPNHIHLLWRIHNKFSRRDVQGALLSFTAHRFKDYLRKTSKTKLFQHFVAEKDREFQFWERDAMVKECWSETFLLQKLHYIHNNLCQPHWQLAAVPEAYRWSSAQFYHNGKTEFDWLTHYAL